MRHASLTLALLLLVGTARAGEPVASTELGRGHAAWLRGDFEAAKDLFAAAVERGNLQRSELLDAYVSLGSAWTVLGQKERALASYRNAAIIDEHFHVPDEAGKKAIQYAEVARKQAARIGQIALKVDHGSFTPSSAADVTVKLDAGQSAFVAKIVLHAESGKETFDVEEPSATDLVFHLPGTLIQGETVTLALRGLDTHGSELAKYNETATVVGATKRKGDSKGLAEAPKGRSDKGSHGKSFWSTPWPYVIGGVVLVGAASTAVYFWKFAPVNEVSVTQVQVNAIR